MKSSAAEAVPKPFFLPVPGGSCFCLFHPPTGEMQRGSILYLHPFAEELNTTRRIVAHQARALGRLGYGVLQVDLLGCGDSTGEFEEANWSSWMETAITAGQWLQEKISGPFWIWGLRAGALLAAALAQHFQVRQQHPVHLLFWQPVASGQQMLQQFLRLHNAGAWMGFRNSEQPSAMQRLKQGETVDIAGYALSANFAQELSKIQLLPPDVCKTSAARLIWLEVSSQTNPSFSPSSEKIISEWRKSGWEVEAQTFLEGAFWQTINDSGAPLLCNATQNALLRLSA